MHLYKKNKNHLTGSNIAILYGIQSTISINKILKLCFVQIFKFVEKKVNLINKRKHL